MRETSRLPAGFEALEPFVAKWSPATADERLRCRLASTEAERIAFFAAAKDLVAPALSYLDRKPLDQFDAAEKRLMRLMLTFAHISIAVEIQREEEPKHAAGAQHLHVTRAPSERHA